MADESWRRLFTNDESGAVDYAECPKMRRFGRSGPRCRCEKCAFCGEYKHTAVHGPVYQQPPDSKPWGHKFRPIA